MSAWTVIDHEEVPSGGVASITFSSIPATYTDLLLYVSSRGNPNSVEHYFGIKLNGGTTNSGNNQILYGDGSSPAVFTYTSANSSVTTLRTFVTGNSGTANTFGITSFYLPNYAGSTNKSVSIDSVGERNGTTAYQVIGAGLWANTAAITSVELVSLDGNGNAGQLFMQYTSATLYGITKGSSGGVSVS